MSRSILIAPCQWQLLVRKSRFVCHATRVDRIEQALHFIDSVRDDSASHTTWAFRIGSSYRSSDDGEPAGTAGRPILAAIDGQGLDRTVAVVLRWFGGIKLGAGGLVRAYGGCAAECLRRGERAPWVESVTIEVDLGFTDLGTVHQLAAGFQGEKLAERFHPDGACLILRVPADRLPDLRVALRDATQGRARLREPDSTPSDD